MRRFVRAAVVFGLLAGATGWSPTVASAGAPKVEICHYDADGGAYTKLRVAQPALAAHLRHGDGQPGDVVPGTGAAFKFGEDCGLESATLELNFGSSDLSRSTVETSSGSYFVGLVGANPSNVPALPADSTFTLPFSSGIGDRQGVYWRYEFVWPAGYSTVTLDLRLRVNDEMAVWLNDSVIAIQEDTALVPNTVLTYQIVLNADDSVITRAGDPLPGPGWDTWDYVNVSQASFLPGQTNELTIYGVDTCCGGGGGISNLAGAITLTP